MFVVWWINQERRSIVCWLTTGRAKKDPLNHRRCVRASTIPVTAMGTPAGRHKLHSKKRLIHAWRLKEPVPLSSPFPFHSSSFSSFYWWLIQEDGRFLCRNLFALLYVRKNILRSMLFFILRRRAVPMLPTTTYFCSLPAGVGPLAVGGSWPIQAWRESKIRRRSIGI